MPLYTVEFKSGGTEFYYSSEYTFQFNIRGLVIVEADRRISLGKIVGGILIIKQANLLLQKCQKKVKRT